MREIGGQYTHGSSRFVDALTKLAEKAAADGDKAQTAQDCARAVKVSEALLLLTKTSP